MITVISGGTGTPKLLTGLIKLVAEDKINVIANTGDDEIFYGLHVSPDIDSIIYTLSGQIDEEKWWGIKNDTFTCMKAIKRFYPSAYFNLGDIDIATHIFRTELLHKGYSLTQVTKKLCNVFHVIPNILPMCNERVKTIVNTIAGRMSFQEFWVRRKGKDRVTAVFYEGSQSALLTKEVKFALSNAERIIIGPSNPITSIKPILSIPGIKKLLTKLREKCIAISPMVGTFAYSGPAVNLLRGVGLEPTSFGVAEAYKDVISTLVIDTCDREMAPRIEEKFNISVIVRNTSLATLDDRTSFLKNIL
jgi:LPPG:FO 2-phospho-L-lactate transferase